MDINGNHLLRIQEGMAAVLDIDVMVPVEHRGAALVVSGQGRLREYKIQVGEDVQVRPQLLLIGGQLIAQICQDGLNLLLLLDLQSAQVVV